MSQDELHNQESSAACDGTGEAEDPCFYVVAIGASAGGLESLGNFFKAMPSDSGMAFVVLQHLSPDFRSLMDELLARDTDMKIRKAEDGMAVEPNTIYLNPPRKNMIVSGGNLYLSEIDPEQVLSLPIDQFFRSLAQDYRRQCIGVVLSGTGSDGSRGIRDIHEAGGLVLAETEETAKFDGMPRSAQETGCVHLVLPPAAMPEALVSYMQNSLSPQDFAEKTFVPPLLGGLEAVFRMLHDEYGIDFSLYKPNTVVRRIERRINLKQATNIDKYVERLENDSDELSALYHDLLIGVTQFFRDRDAFEYLRSDVIPRMVAEKSNGDELRVWIAGCATGEEAYTYAMLIDREIQESKKDITVKILATDVHTVSLDFASAGVYPEDSFAKIDNDLTQRYFEKTSHGWRVHPRLRKTVVFANHNVFEDAPFTRLDLVSCRNLLIYLQALAQKKAVSLFHFGLRANGVLVLGPSESTGELKEEFETLNHRWKVFRKRRDIRLSSAMRVPLSVANSDNSKLEDSLRKNKSTHQHVLLRAYDLVLARLASAGFLVDDNRELIHVFGDAAEFLTPPIGRVSRDFFRLVRSKFQSVIGALFHRVKRGDETTVTSVVQCEEDDTHRHYQVSVEKLVDQQVERDWFLITIEPQLQSHEKRIVAERVSSSDLSAARLNELEVELRYTKENLQATVEELETSNEELQATNEELIASNEELQSTNEELHSVNEELYTVNAEYQNKISELSEITDDMNTLLESTEIGTIFLDADLTIRKHTGTIEKWFDLAPGDIGRRISAFSHRLNYSELMRDIEGVLQSNEPFEVEIQDESGSWLHLRLHPYKTVRDSQGVVMTLIDISSLRQTRAKMQRLSAIVESSDDAIIGQNFHGRIESWNQAAEALFGYTAHEAIGENISLILPENTTDEATRFTERIKNGESVEMLETRRRTKDGRLIDIAIRFSPIRNDQGKVVGLSGICRDISQQKDAQRELQRLATIVKYTDNAVVLTDREGRIEWVNDGFEKITGFRLNESKGRKPSEILQGPASDPQVIDEMSRCVANGEGFNVEIINYTKSREPYWIAIDCRPLFDKHDALEGFMAIERDVTDLKEAQAAAEREINRRDEFLAVLSHELRNPMAALKNGLELLQQAEPKKAAPRHDIEDVMQTQLGQISRLLDDLLDVARLTQNKLEIYRELIDLRTTAESAVAMLAAQAERCGCKIRLKLPQDVVVVRGDEIRLQQVQVNLLANAIKHSNPGDEIELSIVTEDDLAIIVVQDQGEGIEPEKLANVFELFFQSKSPGANVDGGLGLGLSLVRDLVEKHHGEVSIDSEGLGLGTTVRVTLPLAHEPLPERNDNGADEVQPLKVVLVEDQVDNRLMLRQLLEYEGHTVIEAATGLEGFKSINASRPDVALVDIGLPDMPGYEVAKRIREFEISSETLLVALTGFGQDSDVQKAKESGFDTHFVKPLNVSDLHRFVAGKRGRK